jgi:hypothetical protein
MGYLLEIDPLTVCALVGTDNAVGAQTERRGMAGSGRGGICLAAK